MPSRLYTPASSLQDFTELKIRGADGQKYFNCIPHHYCHVNITWQWHGDNWRHGESRRMANRMPGEIWSIRQQKDWNAGLSRKNNTDFQLPHAPPVQNLCYWWQQAKMQTFESSKSGNLLLFPIAEAKAVCTCFNHHSHRPSLPASSSPWSLEFLKQRVQKESEKEIQWSVICPVLCVVAHHLRMVQVIKHSMEFLPAVENSSKAAQVDHLLSFEFEVATF